MECDICEFSACLAIELCRGDIVRIFKKQNLKNYLFSNFIRGLKTDEWNESHHFMRNYKSRVYA